MASVDDDEENFAEDECTIEFGEEEPPPAAPTSTGYQVPGVVGGPRFVEYPGEDFSRYLNDTTAPTPDYDVEEDQAPSSGSGARRRYIKNINNAKATTGPSRLHRPTSSSAAPAAPAPAADNTYMIADGDVVEDMPNFATGPSMIPPPASPAANRRTSLSTVRERVGRLLSRGQTGQRRSQSGDRLNVANFTFADSKIGSMMLAQREREQELQTRQFVDDDPPPETQSDLGVNGLRTWWDVGTLSWSRNSVPLRNGDSGGAKSGGRRRSSNYEETSGSVPDLSDDRTADRRSLIGSISKAVIKARARRSSDAGIPSPTSPSSASPTSDQPTSVESTTTVSSSSTSSPAAPRNNQTHEVKGHGDGRGGTKRGKLFQRLKDGVGSRAAAGREQTTTTQRRKSDDQTNAVSAPRYTRIYDQMNRMTEDFRQSTVDNPLP